MLLYKFNAPYLFTGTKMLDDNWVLIANSNGTIEAIVKKEDAGDDIQFFKGIICPGFVNCHCHVELSHMKGLIKEHTGLVTFIKNILQNRNAETEIIIDAAASAIKKMEINGIVAVGDICNTTYSLAAKQLSNMHFHNFVELSGFNPLMASLKWDDIKDVYHSFLQTFPTKTSLVPHAPYSTSLPLLQIINERNNHALSSIHMQECKDENLFFETAEGSFNQLYQYLQVPISTFHSAKNINSLQYFIPHFQQPQKTILVHNTFSTVADVKWLQKNYPNKQYFHCFCVNANSYIENTLPPILEFMQNNCTMVIGTDSLASNDELSVLAELQTIQQHFSNITTATLLQWATNNGAIALGLENAVGNFEKNKKPSIVGINNISNNGSFTNLSTATVLL